MNLVSFLSRGLAHRDVTRSLTSPPRWILRPHHDAAGTLPAPSLRRPFPLLFLPDLSSLPSLKAAHAVLLTAGAPHRHLRELICSYILLGSPEMALHVYRTAKDPTVALRNFALRCLSDHQLHTHVLAFYAASCDHPSDCFTFPSVIKACTVAASPPLAGRAVHCRALRVGCARDVVVQTALVGMYSKSGDASTARKVFDGMLHRDLVSWNALLSGYSSNGLDREVLRTFQAMVGGGFMPNESTLVCTIPACGRLGEVGAGRSLHCLALRNGLINVQALLPTLISMYSAFGKITDAKQLFETGRRGEDVVAWNALISGYSQNGKAGEACELFCEMHHHGIMPQLISLVSLLPSCGDVSGCSFGESVHGLAIKCSFVSELSIATSLISMYAKLGSPDASLLVFSSMPERNLPTWNSMVSGLVSNGRWSLALEMFAEMQLAGEVPDWISVVCVLSACGGLSSVLLGKSVHAFCLRNGLECCQNVMTAMISMYNSCCRFALSLNLFRSMPCKDCSSWNSLISGSAQLGMFGMAVSLFRQMQQSENTMIDIVSLIIIVPVCGQLKDLGMGISCHGYAIKASYDSDIALGNALIGMYTSCGDLEAGSHLFDTMASKDVVSWNVIMTGFRNHNLDAEVVRIFRQMRICGEIPNKVTMLNVLPVCSNELMGRSGHGYALRKYGNLEDSIVTSIMCMYARFERIDPCLALFRISDKQNIVVWNTMMSIFAQSQHVEGVMLYFQQLLHLPLKPDDVTILNLVSSVARLGLLDLAQNVTGYVVKQGFGKTISISNALVDMLARCGDISLAEEVFESIVDKDLVSWSAMMNSYGMHGKGEAALALFSEMKRTGIEPDGVAFLGLLSACSHSGLLEQGRKIFQSMEEHHVLPRQEHFACMVDLLGRTGHLTEARDLIRRAPFKPTSSMLESLLGACNLYSNSELGDEVERMLSESEPSSSYSLLMLSKIYGGKGQWANVYTLRAKMELKGLVKKPGFSLITTRMANCRVVD